MITKTPDYMISECGYPELWSGDSKHLPLTQMNSKFWNSYTSWCNGQTATAKFNKLLPLRESWTDYYTKNLIKQNEESNNNIHKYNRLASVQKQQKNHYNEVLVGSTRNKSFHCKR